MPQLPITLLCFSYTRASKYYRKTLDILNEDKTLHLFKDRYVSLKVLDGADVLAVEMLIKFQQYGFRGTLRQLQTNPTNTLEYQNEYLLDVIAASKNPDVLKNPYILWFESDSPFQAKTKTMLDLMNKAVGHFLKDDLGRRTTVQYRFLRDTNDITLPVHKDFLIEKDFNFQPMLIPTDYFVHCCNLLEKNWDQLKNYQCEMAFRIVADTISPHSYRYKVFLPEEGVAYHLDGNNI